MAHRIRDLLIYHHSHLDVGYTQHPETIWARQGDFLRLAMDLAERFADRPEGERFKWTAESSAVVEAFFKTASPGEIDRFVALSKAGLMETTAMFCNVTPLFSPSELWASLGVMRRLRREYGLTVESAVNHDVNGEAWILPRLLRALGIEFLVMGINQDSARPPLPRPRAFWWQGPNPDEEILTWNGEHYGYAQYVGIPRPKAWVAGKADLAVSRDVLTRYLDRITDEGYPYDFLLLSVTNTVTWDNDAPNEELVRFVSMWNQEGISPRIRIVTPREVPSFIRRQEPESVPRRRGDWTDWWADGVASTARETAVKRWAGRMFGAAGVLRSLDETMGEADRREFDRLAETVARDLWLFSEHTWGSAESVSHPDTVNGWGQWISKAGRAYEAAAGSRRLWTLAGRGLAGEVKAEEPSVLLFNPLPWEASVRLVLPAYREGESFGAAFPMQELARDLDLAHPVSPSYAGGPPADYGLVPIPALGYRTVLLKPPAASAKSRAERWTLRSPALALRVDPRSGAIRSLVTASDGREWCDPDSPYGLGEYVYHLVKTARGRRDLQPPVPAGDVREDLAVEEHRVERVLDQQVNVGPGLAEMAVTLKAAGARRLTVVYTVYDDAPWLDIEYRIDKDEAPGIESVYLTFPAGLDRPVFHYASGGAVIEGEREQLPNACRDYYSVDWADLSDSARGMTLAAPDAPLMLWGGFTVGRYAEHHTAERPLLVSWALNNKWHTNFRHSQPGEVRLRYRLWPHAGPFDPAASARFGLTAEMPVAVLPVGRGEGAALDPAPTGTRPARQELFFIAPEDVRIIELSLEGTGLARLILEPLRPISEGTLSWGPGRRISAAWETDLNGRRLRQAPLSGEAVQWSGETGHWVAFELELEPRS